MNHGSLFSGIGGFDLAAEWMDWNNVFHCEWNAFGRSVLKYYWPDADSHIDITKTDFKKYANTIDILTGGFPCQPYSVAGKQRGKEDKRHLWPHMLRAIREIQPVFVVAENVRGLISWNEGMVFKEIITDLENEGFEVLPFVLPAVGVNAPHKRDRVWFVAYSVNNRCNRRLNNRRKRYVQNNNKRNLSKNQSKRKGWKRRVSTINQIITNTSRSSFKRKLYERSWKRKFRGCYFKNDFTNSKRVRRRKICEKIQSKKSNGKSFNTFDESNNWEKFPTQSPVCNGNDGLSTQLDGITFPKWRTESVKAGGNAIVPQVALQIFKAIDQIKMKNNIR